MKALSSAVAMLTLAGSANAAVIANYDFAIDTSSGDTEINTTASVFDDGFSANAGRSGLGNYYAFSNAISGSHTTTAGSQASAVTDGSYFTFTVTPQAGYSLDLTSLTFDTVFNLGSTTTNSSFTTNFFVRTSIDNFATTVGGPFTENQQLIVGLGTWTSRNVDLSALAGITSPIELRIYLYDDVNSNLRTARVDNVVLNADLTQIPEPYSFTSWILGLLGAVGFVGFGRRGRWHGKLKLESVTAN